MKTRSKVLAVLALATSLTVVGCTASQITEIESVVNVVIDASASVVSALGDTTVATELTAAANGLKTAESNFAAGTGTEVAISNAALAVEDVLSAIAPGSKASTLADVLVTALDAALAILPAPTASVSAHLYAEAPHATYNHHGRADGNITHRYFRSRAGDFRSAFNAAAKKAGAKTI